MPNTYLEQLHSIEVSLSYRLLLRSAVALVLVREPARFVQSAMTRHRGSRRNHLMCAILLALAAAAALSILAPGGGVAFASAAASPSWRDEAADFLARGDAALRRNDLDASIDHYRRGVDLLPPEWSGEGAEGGAARDGPADASSEARTTAEEAQVIVSLHTNYGTALSYRDGSTEGVLSAYRAACLCYRLWLRRSKDEEGAEEEAPKEIRDTAAQSYHFLGMTYHDLAPSRATDDEREQYLQSSARAYATATGLDPAHWSSFANMGAVLGDAFGTSLGMYEEGAMAYQKAIDILTGGVSSGDGGPALPPTDPPENVRGVVSELHYRIGLCLVPTLFSDEGTGEHSKKQCTLHVGGAPAPSSGADDGAPASITRSCLELAAYQFGTALQFDPSHEGANAALIYATADADFGMTVDASKVRKLFDEYAPTFESSLVDELGYDGFHRMRRIFDDAMKLEGRRADEAFDLVLDAGCGTGLAGEQFRNISGTLVGVDLSDAIIDMARRLRKGLYSSFRTGDVKEVLREYAASERKVSLLVAADTFIYFNDLGDLLASIEQGLEVGGYAGELAKERNRHASNGTNNSKKITYPFLPFPHPLIAVFSLENGMDASAGLFVLF